MAEFISKSEKKRQFKQVENVAAELAELSNNDLKNFPGSDSLKQEILATRGVKGGAKKRQIKYVAKVMRQESLTEIYDFLEQRKGSQLRSKQQHHEAERLRDGLINEALDEQRNCQQQGREWEMSWQSETLANLLARYPEIPESDVRKAVYSYIKTRNRLHYRELFRMIKAAIEQEVIKQRLA